MFGKTILFLTVAFCACQVIQSRSYDSYAVSLSEIKAKITAAVAAFETEIDDLVSTSLVKPINDKITAINSVISTGYETEALGEMARIIAAAGNKDPTKVDECKVPWTDFIKAYKDKVADCKDLVKDATTINDFVTPSILLPVTALKTGQVNALALCDTYINEHPIQLLQCVLTHKKDVETEIQSLTATITENMKVVTTEISKLATVFQTCIDNTPKPGVGDTTIISTFKTCIDNANP